MGIFLMWIVLSVLAAWAAGNKGRSWFGVLLLSLILSPLIGFIVALIMKPNVPPAPAAALAVDPSLGVCPWCAEDIKLGAIKCKHCGGEVTPYVAPPSAPGYNFRWW